jgi:imidazolonepropionase-like amidohydrolase
MKHTLTLLFIAFTSIVIAQTKRIIYTNATLHIGNTQVISNATLAIEKGKIVNANNNYMPLITDSVIDASNQHIYPGIIAPFITLGLTEVDAVRSTIDFAEAGNINPHVRAQIAYNTDSKIIPTVRSNGVLLVQSTPRGGLISGQSSVMSLNGWNWEDATIKADDGVHVNWPSLLVPSGWSELGPTGWEKNKNYETQLQTITQFLLEAKAYNKTPTATINNQKLKAMKDVFSGTKRLYIYANTTKELTEAIHLILTLEIKHPVIIGGAEAYKVADLFTKNNIPIIIGRTHAIPTKEDADIYANTKLANELKLKNILFAISDEGDMEAMQARNLPFQAGTTVAFGLTKEEALQAITLNPAKIMGIDANYGTLEVGKSATFFISTGDALDAKSNNVIAAYTNGNIVDLNNHQKELYKKYATKFGLKP